jgi:hypothetical protein
VLATERVEMGQEETQCSGQKQGRDIMHAVVRNYSGKGSKKLIDAIEKNKTEVEELTGS